VIGPRREADGWKEQHGRVGIDEHIGYDGLLDRRRGRPSPRKAPFSEVQRILHLYRTRYAGFNARHFHQVARRDHQVTLSYTYVKPALQHAGLLPKQRARGRHRRRREPRPCFGELVHLDGSRHRWLALAPEQSFTLIVAVDDATKRLLYARLVDSGESLDAIMTALRRHSRAVRHPRRALHRPRGVGRLHADVRHWSGPHETHAGRPRSRPPRH
jgi:hypothetical protein